MKIHIIISISHTKLSTNLELIHRAVLKKLRLKKKSNQILTSNISEIYFRELDLELSIIYLYKEF